MSKYPSKFDSLFNKVSKNEGYYELNIELDQIDLILDLLRLDKDYQEYLFDTLFRAYLIENPNYLGTKATVEFKNFIYRGQKDYNWKLVPNSLRDYNKPYSDFELKSILDFIDCTDELNLQIPSDSTPLRNKIKSLLYNSTSMSNNNWINDEFYEMLGYAQHYGAITRLLDWSHHPLVSLYFASIGLLTTGNEIDQAENFSLYILNTDHLKIKNPPINLVDVIDIPKGLNKHISYQKGCFTLTKQNEYKNTPKTINIYKALNIEYDVTPILIPDVLKENQKDYCLLKINFHKSSAKQVFRYCNSMGFNASNIYEAGEALKKRIIEIPFLKN